MYTHTGRGILRALTTALRPNYNGNASWLWRRGGLIKYSPVHEGGDSPASSQRSAITKVSYRRNGPEANRWVNLV